jgi:2-oxoglutarate ferredoxin oxidoreductase subunit beta
LYLAAGDEADDLHARMNTLDRPLNQLDTADLVPGSKVLDKLNASLR